MNNMRLIGCCMILFQTVFGMNQQNRLQIVKDFLPVIIEYAVQSPNLFEKRRNLYQIAQTSRQFRKASSQVLNQKENKSTIKCIIKAGDWVDEELLRSTPKNCPYGIKKIKVINSDIYETIGYLIERKQRRVNALAQLALLLISFKYTSSQLVANNSTAIINILNKRKIILSPTTSSMALASMMLVLETNRVESAQFYATSHKIVNFLNGASTATLLYFSKYTYDYYPFEPSLNNSYKLLFVYGIIFTKLITYGISLNSLNNQKILNIYKTLKKNSTTMPSNSNYTIPPIHFSWYDHYIDWLTREPRRRS